MFFKVYYNRGSIVFRCVEDKIENSGRDEASCSVNSEMADAMNLKFDQDWEDCRTVLAIYPKHKIVFVRFCFTKARTYNR